MRHPDRPYRWGNWITVGLITGQLVGMFSSPLHVEADLQDAAHLLASVVAPGPAQALPVIEVHIGLAPPRDPGGLATDERAAAVPSSPTGPDDTLGTTGRSAPPPSSDSTMTAERPGSQQDTPTGTTGPPSTTGTTGTPSTRPTTSTDGPGPASTATTAVVGPSTTDPDELGASAARRPCEVAATVRSSWLVIVSPGPFDRLAVLALLAGLDDDQLVARSDTSWLADASAGRLCLVAGLPGVIDVTEVRPGTGGRPTTSTTATDGSPTGGSATTSAPATGTTGTTGITGTTGPTSTNTSAPTTGTSEPAGSTTSTTSAPTTDPDPNSTGSTDTTSLGDTGTTGDTGDGATGTTT